MSTEAVPISAPQARIELVIPCFKKVDLLLVGSFQQTVNVVYIDTEILGRRIATRSVVPALKDRPKVTMVEVLDLCIANHLSFYKSPPSNSPNERRADK